MNVFAFEGHTLSFVWMKQTRTGSWTRDGNSPHIKPLSYPHSSLTEWPKALNKTMIVYALQDFRGHLHVPAPGINYYYFRKLAFTVSPHQP